MTRLRAQWLFWVLAATNAHAVAQSAGATEGSLRYRLDVDHTTIEFAVGSIKGEFKEAEATIDVDAIASSALFEVQISTRTAKANNRIVTSMLRSEDWFDVRAHPQATFTADQPLQRSENPQLDGTLVVKGIAKSLRLTVDFPRGAPSLDPPPAQFDFVASTEFSRSDFDMGKFPKMAPDLVEIRIKGVFRRSE